MFSVFKKQNFRQKKKEEKFEMAKSNWPVNKVVRLMQLYLET